MSNHKIEETARVYLLWDGLAGAWVIDPLCTDGGALDGSDDGPYICCDNLPDDQAHPLGETCEQEQARAMRASLPNAEELLILLAGQLGYTVTEVTS